jgi:energy-coupling factor transport system ATP-binding protein
VWALRDVHLALHGSQVTALMGRNGAGKSTLLAAAAGVTPVVRGDVERAGRVALVPQEPGDLLWSATVGEECADADRDWSLPPGSTLELLACLAPDVDAKAHPRDLSEGQRLMLALAVMLTSRPQVLALDEPTRGLDYAAKRRLVDVLRDLAASGICVVLATHDVELAAEVADRVVILADGEVVADGPVDDVVLASPAFAPQVAKVFAPVRVLTLAEAMAALA